MSLRLRGGDRVSARNDWRKRMGSNTLRDLVGQMRSGRLSRRRFVTRAAAMGLSATAISGALRQVPTRAQTATEVTMWTAFSAKDFDNVNAVVTAYNQQASGNQVKLVQVPPAQTGDVTKLMTAVRAGTGPDIYFLDRFTVAQNAAGGLLQDLSALGAEQLIGNYIAFARDEASFNGKVWALPFDTDARALFYNKAMLQSAGVDPAELDAAKGPVTWDKVAEIATKLNVKDSNGNFTQMGFVPWVDDGHPYTYGFSYGGKFFDYAACQVTPDDPPIVAALQWVQDYCKALDADKVDAFGGP